VDVTDHRDWRKNVHDIALLHQQLFRLGTYCLDDGLGEQLFLAQPRYTLI
jgi:hypothetical protein